MTTRDQALRAAMHVTHHTPWDTTRDLARLVVHLARARVQPQAHVDCADCRAAIEAAEILAAALDSWDRAHG